MNRLMKTELLTRREDLLGLATQWDELAQNDRRDGFFRTSAWYLSWMEHIRPDARPFVIAVRDDSGDLVGVAPLCKFTYKDHGFRLRAISPAGREVVSGDFLDYVTAPHVRREALETIIDCLQEVQSEWELLVAGDLIQGGDLQTAMEAFANKGKFPIHYQEERTCPYIELPRTYEEYLSRLSQKMRYEIRRDTRDLLGKLGAQIDVYTEPADVCEHLDTMIALHLAHWNRANQPGTMGRSGFDCFLKQVCSAPPPGASCRLYLLKHEQKPAAALLAFCSGENAMFYQTGWDPDSPLARFSPGMVLIGRSIQDAIQLGFRYFDFLRGDETYKTRLTKTSRKTITLLLARSLLAKEYLRLAGMKDSVKRFLVHRKYGEAALEPSTSRT